jgi:hypothetical protein
MDLISIAVEAFWIFAVSLLAQPQQDTPWNNWARQVNERFVKDGSAIKELQDQAVQTDGALRDAQRSLAVQQEAMRKLAKAMEEIPGTVSELRATANEIAQRTAAIQEAIAEIKAQVASSNSSRVVDSEETAHGTLVSPATAVGVVACLLVLIAIGFIQSMRGDVEEVKRKLDEKPKDSVTFDPAKINETGSLTTGG